MPRVSLQSGGQYAVGILHSAPLGGLPLNFPLFLLELTNSNVSLTLSTTSVLPANPRPSSLPPSSSASTPPSLSACSECSLPLTKNYSAQTLRPLRGGENTIGSSQWTRASSWATTMPGSSCAALSSSIPSFSSQMECSSLPSPSSPVFSKYSSSTDCGPTSAQSTIVSACSMKCFCS